jgi:phosphopantothenoylcysteine synthetase/decarboxylase
MNILVTAGNTFVPIDRVRGITNIFTGRTGTQIAEHCKERGHTGSLLTSHPELANGLVAGSNALPPHWDVLTYRFFEELQELMERQLKEKRFDALIHCAAVSDYRVAGTYATATGTQFDPQNARWISQAGQPTLVERAGGKIKSDERELWLRLMRTPKLVDQVRRGWDFQGILVKFKLEVGMSDNGLLDIAEQSRQQSGADLMVANTLEGITSWAYLGPIEAGYERVQRQDLASRLIHAVEQLHKERAHG